MPPLAIERKQIDSVLEALAEAVRAAVIKWRPRR